MDEVAPRKLGGYALLLRLVIAAAIVGLVVVYAREIDWAMIGRAIAAASIPLLVLSALGNLPLVWLKAARMKLLVDGQVGTVRLMGMYVASYAADNMVMSQAGIALRVALLRRDGVPVATGIAVQALEKLLEGIGLALLAVPLLATVELDARLATTLQRALIIGAAAFALVALVVLANRRDLKIFRRIADTARQLRDWRALLGLTMAAWVVEIAIVWVTFWAMHVPVTSLAMPTLVLVAVSLAALIPGLPGNMGSFEIAGVLALHTFGIGDETALSFVLVYHALHTIPVTVIGVLVGQYAQWGSIKKPHVAKAGPTRN
jgi:uncharacterized membrane protein YbhN (UPF0104 family)